MGNTNSGRRPEPCLSPPERVPSRWKENVSDRALRKRCNRPTRAPVREDRKKKAVELLAMLQTRLNLDDGKSLGKMLEEAGLGSLDSRECQHYHVRGAWEKLRAQRKELAPARKNELTRQRYRRDPQMRAAAIERGKESFEAKKRAISFGQTMKKGRTCQDCHEGSGSVLEWHHRPDTEKKFCISRPPFGITLAQVTEEILKCDLICANCHRLRHSRS